MNRRRFMRIAAASASCGAASFATPLAWADPAPVEWCGLAMGNLASIEIRHTDAARANRLLDSAKAEIARLESIMSLYRPESALSVLNRDRMLREPPLDLVRVLSEAQRFGALTGGMFDVSVQPLWKLYADHFSRQGSDPAGPKPDLVARAAERVDYRALEIEPTIIGLGRPGMQVTLNGIAQGYITDRIVELLRNEGLDHVLVDLGEIRAIGGRDGRQPWRAGIEGPLNTKAELAGLPLRDNALATSGGYGFQFDSGGRFHHIFDPATGSCPHRYASVSVVAPDATTADALATAGNLMSPDVFTAALRAAGAERALVVGRDGAQRWLLA
jgi:thiamine biosynthesis lipoprotein